MIFGIYTLSFSLSTLIRLLNNWINNEKLKENGYDFVESDRSTVLRVTSFIKEYFYLLVPIFNLYKTVKDCNSKFYSKYYDYLNSNKLLVEAKKKLNNETKNESSKEVTKKEEVKKSLPPVITPKNNLAKNTIVKQTFSSNSLNSNTEFNNLINYIMNCTDYNELHKMHTDISSRESKLKKLYSDSVENGCTNFTGEIESMITNCNTLKNLITNRLLNNNIDRSTLTFKKSIR